MPGYIPAQGRHKGFAIIVYQTMECAFTAVEMYHDYDLNGRRLKVKLYEANENYRKKGVEDYLH
jgi:RNA recognition motif-containing protein